jgi:hypothetical protein
LYFYTEAFVNDVDDTLSKFDIDMDDDDLTHMDIMPPPIFSRATIPKVYKYLPSLALSPGIPVSGY